MRLSEPVGAPEGNRSLQEFCVQFGIDFFIPLVVLKTPFTKRRFI